MTSTTFFTGSVPASAKRAAPLANKAMAGARAAFKAPRPAAAAATSYSWMTPTMLGNLSLRARRLLRADY